MDKLTIDEAIRHCEEVAKEQNRNAAEYNEHDEWEFVNKCNCEQCAADHLQLAEWLTNYKEAIRLLKAAVEDLNNSVNDVHCKYCSKWHTDQCQSTSHLDCYVESKFKWRYADEVEKLLKED